jgi:Cytochrome P460
VIVANPTMIQAYKAGVPGNGQPFPDGSMIVKLQWKPKKSTEALSSWMCQTSFSRLS